MVAFFTLILMASLVIQAFLLTRLWALRRAPGSVELLLCTLACGAWSIGYAFEILAPGLAQKVFWAKFQYLGIATIPVWVLLFINRYCGYKTWFSIRDMLALMIVPVLTMLITATTESHGWMWSSIALQPGWPTAPLSLGHGGWFWVQVAYGYLLLVGGSALLVQFVLRTQKLYLSQSIVMMVAMVIPWLGNLLYMLGVRPGPNIDLTPLAFTISNIGLVIAFTGFRLLDILPVAYSSIFQFMGDGVVVLDTQNRIVDINPAARQIFSGTNFSAPTRPIKQQKGVKDAFIGRRMDEVLPNWSNAGQDESEMSLAQRVEKANRIYTLRTTSILNRSERVTGKVLIFSDITKIKNAEEQMKLAHEQALEGNRMKTQLLANVSHDMRTPLGAITGYSEMLRAGVYGELVAEQKEAVADIQDSANELLLFVNNLIGQAQFDTGKILVKPKPFPIQDLIEDCQAALRLQASRKGLRIDFAMDPAVPETLVGDSYWLRQVVINIANNAVKFTDHGSVKIRVYLPDPQHWAIDVVDTGIGIPETAQAAIFEPFRQVDGSMTRERSGSGLGLAIARELTILMDGQISLTSLPGCGSTFTVCFPFVTKE